MADNKRSPLGILFLTLFIDLVGFSIIFPLFPDLLEHYLGLEEEGGLLARLLDFLQSVSGASESEPGIYTEVLFGGFLGSIFSILQFVCAPLWGGLSDRIGRRPVLLLSIAGTAVSYAVWFVSGSFLLLLVSRFLGGCSSGNIATATAAVADCTPARDRAKGMGFIGAAFGLGFILGPAIGALSVRLDLSEVFPSWTGFGVNPFSSPALVAFLLSLLNILWVYLRFEETLAPENRTTTVRTRRPINPLVLFHRFGIPGVNQTNLAYFLYITGFAGLEFTLTFFAKEGFGYTAESMWSIFVFVGVIIVIVQGGVVRRVAPRFGERRVSTFGLFLLLPSFVIIAYSPPEKWLLFLGLGIMSVGSALATPCLTSLVSLYAPADRQGSMLGIFRSLGALGRALGPIVFAGIYWKFGEVNAYLAGATLLVVPVALALVLPAPPENEPGGNTTS